MRAVVQDRYGPPDVLRIAEVERPTPKDDEVLIRIRVTTVSQTDTHYPPARSLRVAPDRRSPAAEVAIARGRAGGSGRGDRIGCDRV